MPRIARVTVSGYPHHVTQRGNNRDTVFFDDEDRGFCKSTLKSYCHVNLEMSFRPQGEI